jgi:hypothetical protein
MSVANRSEGFSDCDDSPVKPREKSHALPAPNQQRLSSSLNYLLRLAAFHFAQRARWAAAIRLRAAADIGLRFLGA